tara:strand:- start:1402 stop:1698 length:297 start_codon:yes stop_codon:yes gene_type:complete
LISTFPTLDDAKDIANQAIKEKFAACVNIIPSHSVYSWNDSVESSDEFLTIFKTTNSNVSKLRNLISTSHSYDVPEIIDFELNNVNKPYLDWLIQSMS